MQEAPDGIALDVDIQLAQQVLLRIPHRIQVQMMHRHPIDDTIGTEHDVVVIDSARNPPDNLHVASAERRSLNANRRIPIGRRNLSAVCIGPQTMRLSISVRGADSIVSM